MMFIPGDDLSIPCRIKQGGKDYWFSPVRDRERAVRMCQECPFLGRCAYNAVASHATHGVWGGVVLPGDKPKELAPLYVHLLQQYEARREIELGLAPAPPLPDPEYRRRGAA